MSLRRADPLTTFYGRSTDRDSQDVRARARAGDLLGSLSSCFCGFIFWFCLDVYGSRVIRPRPRYIKWRDRYLAIQSSNLSILLSIHPALSLSLFLFFLSLSHSLSHTHTHTHTLSLLSLSLSLSFSLSLSLSLSLWNVEVQSIVKGDSVEWFLVRTLHWWCK